MYAFAININTDKLTNKLNKAINSVTIYISLTLMD